MKITFDNNNTINNVEQGRTTAYRGTHAEEVSQMSAYTLDISGTVMDNNAYKGQGKTAEDVMQAAGQTDIAVQRDFITVMSNTMSTEDFKKIEQDGYHAGDMEAEEVVTILDTIKAELVKSGVQIDGYTDRIDMEALESIVGSEAFARELCAQFAKQDIPVTEENARNAKEAYDRAKELQDMTEGSMKYMVENHMQPTIDNLYLADYSSTADGNRQGRGYYADVSGYYAKKAEEFNWKQLLPQMEKIIEEAGLDVEEDTLNDAKWIIEKGIPLTREALADLHKLRNMQLPQDEKQILSAVAAAIADGKSAGEANLADDRSNLEKAADYVERFERITDETVDKAVKEEKPLTLANLEMIQNKPEDSYVPAEDVTARRQLEEVRLIMTIEANRKLLESGYSIDTTELEQLVEALKEIEARQKQLLFNEPDTLRAAEKAALYTETNDIIAQIPQYPIDMIGRFKVTDEDFTLNHVHVEGSALKNDYESAGRKYEAWMTEIRPDLGDSIKKAFRSVDDILQDLEMEVDEENRRAIRILGYNKMELSEENMRNVIAADRELHSVISKMTPAVVLQTIRDGRNPLEMTISELDDYLTNSQYEQEQETEKYSKFLYNLEKNNQITEQEREAYIGIYRMFRQFEKTDDAAVGAILNTGAELSFKNLLSVIRSQKKKGMDYVVDDDFTGLKAVEQNISITAQIESGFKKCYRDIVRDIRDQMARQDADIEADYQEEQLQDYRQASEVEDAVINELLQNHQPVTANNLLAADMLMNKRGSLYKDINSAATKDRKEKIKESVSHMKEALTDKDTAQEAYREMNQVFEETLEEEQYDAKNDYIDLKFIQSCHRQLALAANLSQEENYQIPVEINGEMTAIHLKVLHGQDEGGKVKAVFSTESYGEVAAEFSIRNRKISGYIACDTVEGTENLQNKEESLKTAFKEHVDSLMRNELELGTVSVVHSKELNLNNFTAKETQDESAVADADLYKVAKAFITVVAE
ncbi:MAG: DUF6240 domain-containing protein [Butyrivibrio sp.]|nr:DUF6240 domain-containing protein [Butyrivibrio sp.]